MSGRAASRTLLGALLLFLVGQTLFARQDWQWPEKPQNLKKLPADWPGTRLAPVMRGFTNALGVSCSHCHVGEEGQPLSTYDFASDANPKKEIARKMLDLLGTVNEQLGTLGVAREERVNMWCHTCHHGVPKPRRLHEELDFTYRRDGAQATVDHYRELREKYSGTWSYDFSRPALLRVASGAVEAGKADDAVTLLRYELEVHAESSSVHAELAEAYAASGRRELAGIHARRALELDPDDGDWVDLVRRLESPDP